MAVCYWAKLLVSPSSCRDSSGQVLLLLSPLSGQLELGSPVCTLSADISGEVLLSLECCVPRSFGPSRFCLHTWRRRMPAFHLPVHAFLQISLLNPRSIKIPVLAPMICQGHSYIVWKIAGLSTIFVLFLWCIKPIDTPIRYFKAASDVREDVRDVLKIIIILSFSHSIYQPPPYNSTECKEWSSAVIKIDTRNSLICVCIYELPYQLEQQSWYVISYCWSDTYDDV